MLIKFACLAAVASAAFTAKEANDRFANGANSNDYEKAGLLMHQFDFECQETRWTPCIMAGQPGAACWCPYDDRISSLVANAEISIQNDKISVYTVPQGSNPVGYQPAGVLINTSVVDVMCTYSNDGGTYDRVDAGCGCHKNDVGTAQCKNNSCESTDRNPQAQCAYGPGHLEDMMEDMEKQHALYNEIVVNPKSWKAGLPHTILAFWYPTGGQNATLQTMATTDAYRAHQLFNAKYPDHQVPLFVLDVNGGNAPFKLAPDTPPGPGPSPTPAPGVPTPPPTPAVPTPPGPGPKHGEHKVKQGEYCGVIAVAECGQATKCNSFANCPAICNAQTVCPNLQVGQEIKYDCSLTGQYCNGGKPTPAPPAPGPLPPSPIPAAHAETKKVYWEHTPAEGKALTNHNAGDVGGTLHFLFVDMLGANASTPSDEGNPSKTLLTEFTVEYDNRTTGYSSCDTTDGSTDPTDFTCVCKHEKDIHGNTPCELCQNVGTVDLAGFYNVAQVNPCTGDSCKGCNWLGANHCQYNLGKKLASGKKGSFTWYAFPKCIENAKWQQKAAGKSVRTFCVLDGVSSTVAPKCVEKCNQNIPSIGIYNECYFECFFSTLLGPDFATGNTEGTAATPVATLEQAFRDTFVNCPAETWEPEH